MKGRPISKMNDDPGSTSLHIEVAILDAAWPDSVPTVEALACRAARAACTTAALPEDLTAPEISIVLSDDARVQLLNKTYRQKDGPTNVLSFPAFDSPQEAIDGAVPGQPVLLGDVVLARETLLREAQDQRKTAEDHLCHLVVHGVLHLLGHDHVEDSDAAVMERLEADVLATLGVANPYNLTPAAAGLAQASGR